MSQKYGVRGYPTVVFADPRGEVVAKLQSRAPNAVAKQIGELAKKYRMKKPVEGGLSAVELPYGTDLVKALAEGKQQKKAVVVIFGDASEKAIATGHALLDKDVAKSLEQFVVVQVPIKKDCKICEQYRVRRGSVIKVLDPTAEDPSAKALATLSGKRNVKSLRTSLKRAQEKWEKIQAGAP